jgi:hypothetical protein
MAQPNHCDGCSQADRCQEAYRRLGCTDGPNVTLTALVAFLLPILVFAGSLGGLNWWLEGRIAGPYQTPLALAVSLATTVGMMLATGVMARRRRKA